MTLLRHRVQTALILILAVAAALLLREWAGVNWLWTGLVLVFAFVALWEWARLLGRTSTQVTTLLLAGLLALGAVFWLPEPSFATLLGMAIGVWGLFLLRVSTAGWPRLLENLLQAALGLLAIPVAAVVMTRMPGLDILLLLLWVAASDIGGYEIGRRFGKTALAPDISPNKTRAGFVGAMGCAALVALLLAAALGLELSGWFVFVVFAALCACFAVVGDLAESLLKRQAGAKDSGTLLPGHGGMLDRVDSLLAAVPIFVLGMKAVRPAVGMP